MPSDKDHSPSPSEPGWGQFLRDLVFQELFQAETPKETMTTTKTIAKSKFVRPEEGSRSYCTELRMFGHGRLHHPFVAAQKKKKKIRLLRKGLQHDGTPNGFIK